MYHNHYSWLTLLGAVFRRHITRDRNTASDNGVGSGSISWQGYDIVTGRMSSSSNLGVYI